MWAFKQQGLCILMLPCVTAGYKYDFRFYMRIRFPLESVPVLGADFRRPVGAGLDIYVQLAVAAFVDGPRPAVTPQMCKNKFQALTS